MRTLWMQLLETATLAALHIIYYPVCASASPLSALLVTPHGLSPQLISGCIRVYLYTWCSR